MWLNINENILQILPGPSAIGIPFPGGAKGMPIADSFGREDAGKSWQYANFIPYIRKFLF